MNTQIKQNSTIDLSKPLISLTFDDGPNTTTTIQVIDKLKKYNVNASFFLIGDYITKDTEKSVKYAVENNCTIENHSKTHVIMKNLSYKEIEDEITFTSNKIEAITNSKPMFFRPPYIEMSDTMYDAVKLPFINGLGSEDWIKTTTSEHRANLIISNIHDGDIILLHDFENNDETVKALDKIIPCLLEKGFQFVNIRQLFEYKKITPLCKRNVIYSNVLQ